MCIFKLIYKKALAIPKLDSYDRYLFVSPHPDDTDVSCGAFISRLKEEGKEVFILNATDGRFGSPVYDPEGVIAKRKIEDSNAKKIYGIDADHIINLPFSDGAKYDEMELAGEIAKVICKVKPEAVISVDYITITESHPDHIKVGRASSYTCLVAGNKGTTHELGIEEPFSIKTLAYYNTDRPNQFIKVSKKNLADQMKAVRCHRSQFSDDEFNLFEKFFKIRAIRAGLRGGHKYAENYRVVSNFVSHCIPEGSEI